MSIHLVLRFLHIMSAVLLVGGVLARQLTRSTALRARDPQGIAAAFQAAEPVERFMVIPGSLLTLVFGLILSLESGAPVLGFLQGASRNWLLVSILLLAAVFILVPAVFLPKGRVFGAHLQDALKQGVITPALSASLNDPLVRAAHVFEIAAVLLVLLLMIFKPF